MATQDSPDELMVIVRTNAKKNAFLGFDASQDAYRVAIKEPPEKGKANRELLRFLSKHFRRQARLISGATSRKKRIRLR
ncbi:MAG: YggU family protein [DPANN group archaeon]|nr:YggU family protein [DPANN group archaeon]